MGKVENPIRVTDIDHVVLRVTDLDKILFFYCNILGCTIERRQDEIGLVQLRAGHALIDLVPVEGKLGRKGGVAPAKEGRNMDHFCLRLQDFEESLIIAHLERHGVEVSEVGIRYGAQGQGPSVYVTDPEGNLVELKGSVVT